MVGDPLCMAGAFAIVHFYSLMSSWACVFPDSCTMGRGLFGALPRLGMGWVLCDLHGCSPLVGKSRENAEEERAESALGNWVLAGTPSWEAGCRKEHSPGDPGSPWH